MLFDFFRYAGAIVNKNYRAITMPNAAMELTEAMLIQT